MPINQKGSQIVIKNLQKAGVKVVGSTAKAAARLAPLMGALSLYSEIEKIPGIGDVLKFTRNAQKWVWNNSLGRIPVVGWFLNEANNKLEDMFDYKHVDGFGTDQIPESGKPGGSVQESENDNSWYGGQLSLPINADRALGYNYTNDLFNYPTLGGVPKLNMIVVDMFEFANQPEFNNSISYLFETMRLNLRSNLTYTLPQVKCFILNNIAYYILCKLLERRMGFMKYKDDQFPQFHELWQYQFRLEDSYDIKPIVKDPNYTITDDAYAQSLDIYESLANSIYQVILPENMKKWIDHYFGSVFLLDDDVKNKKLSFMMPKFVRTYTINAQGEVVEYEHIATGDLTPKLLYNYITTYFNSTTIQTIRTDILKQDNLKEKIKVATIGVGWLQSMNGYTPVVLQDATYKQMIINGYTSSKAIGKDGAIRLDVTTGGVSDLATAVLALGALNPNTSATASVFKVTPLTIFTSSVICYADAKNPVTMPKGFYQQGVQTGETVTYTNPFQMIYTTDVSSDIYLRLTETSTGGEETKVYYPNASFPTSVPSSTKRYVKFNASGATRFVTTSYMNNHYPYPYDMGPHLRFFIPLWEESDKFIGLMSRDDVNVNTSLQLYDYDNAANLNNQFIIKQILKSNVYNGTCLNLRGYTGSQIFNEHIAPSQLGVIPSDIAGDTFDIDNRFAMTGHIQYTVSVRYSGTNLESLGISFGFTGESNSFSETLNAGSPTTFSWVTNILYPSASLAEEYIVTTTEITTYTMSAIAGFMGYAEYLFTATGYSIPVYPVLNIHIQNPVGEESGVFEYDGTLLKEDYVPFIIRQADLPAVWNKMFAGLLAFDINNEKSND